MQLILTSVIKMLLKLNLQEELKVKCMETGLWVFQYANLFRKAITIYYKPDNITTV